MKTERMSCMFCGGIGYDCLCCDDSGMIEACVYCKWIAPTDSCKEHKECTEGIEILTNKKRNMEMEQNLRGLRIRIDSYTGLAKANLSQSKQVEKCIDELYLAKAWLGKALGAIGADSPYRNDGKRKDVKDIEKTADTSTFVDDNDLYDSSNFVNLNQVERVDWMREAIMDTIKTATYTLNYGNYHTSIGSLTIENIFTHLSEARFWLGFELERQREELKTDPV